MPQRLAWPYYPPDFKESPHIELFELFEAYASCRHNKRGTINALAFEVDYEQQLIHLSLIDLYLSLDYQILILYLLHLHHLISFYQ